MTNPLRGEARIKIGRKSYTAVYDWQAIAALREEIGKDFDKQIGEAAVDLDLPLLAKALEIGLRKHHGDELTAEQIQDESPPVVQVNQTIQTALSRAFHGADEPPEDGKENPPSPPPTWWGKLFARRQKRD